MAAENGFIVLHRKTVVCPACRLVNKYPDAQNYEIVINRTDVWEREWKTISNVCPDCCRRVEDILGVYEDD